MSYVWSGIWQAKEVLRRGFKGVLGDGESIRATKDPLVRGRDGYIVDGSYVAVDRGVKVSELFVPGTRQWDIMKVGNLFQIVTPKQFWQLRSRKNRSQTTLLGCTRLMESIK